MSSIETETTTKTGTTTFQHFGETWTVPVTRQHSHLLAIKKILREEGALDADDMAAVYLPVEEYAALVAMNVTIPELQKFADAIAETMGVGDSGNSQPSS